MQLLPEKDLDFLSNAFRQIFAANGHDHEIIRVPRVLDPDVLWVEWVYGGHGSHVFE